MLSKLSKDIRLKFEKAKEELGDKEYNERLRLVFNKPILDFVNNIVINLPEDCYANCDCCIDSYLRNHSIDTSKFLKICEKTFKEFPNINEITITGGSLSTNKFNYLLDLIKFYYNKKINITWNTNGINIKNHSAKDIKYVNLHRFTIDEEENKKLFRTEENDIITLEKAKRIYGDKLTIRITVDEEFDIDEWIDLKIPLYLNRKLRSNNNSDKYFDKLIEKLSGNENNKQQKRRNVYIDYVYKNIPIRVCFGDDFPIELNKYPVHVNVAIIHRSGIVASTWYENSKVLYEPKEDDLL